MECLFIYLFETGKHGQWIIVLLKNNYKWIWEFYLCKYQGVLFGIFFAGGGVGVEKRDNESLIC